MRDRAFRLAVVLGATLLSTSHFACESTDGPARPALSGAARSAAPHVQSQPLCQSAAQRRIRRLSRREYLNLVTDLFGSERTAQLAPLLPPEPMRAGFDNQDEALSVSPAFHEAIVDFAEKLSRAIDPTVLAPCAGDDAGQSCIDRFTRSLATRAFGRPPEPDELQRMRSVAALGEDYAESVRLVVELVMQSPHTLYATELGALDTEPNGEPVALTSYELANQLALILTARRPDETALRLAVSDALSDPNTRALEVDRLLSTDAARVQLRALITGWLDLGPLADAPKDADVYPGFTPALAAAMQRELDAFIDDKLSGGHGDFRALLRDTSTYVTPELLPIYGADVLPGTSPPRLDSSHRRGVLSLPALLTYHSADHHAGPVERGLMVRRQLLCQTVAPPPDAVLAQIAVAPPNARDQARTTRQSFEAHLTEPFCRACHSQFDPIGFGMEEMDGLGRYRTMEHMLPVDSHGMLTGTDVDGPFHGVAALSLKLAESEQVRTCFAYHLLRFVAARTPEPSEECVWRALGAKIVQADGQLAPLLGDIARDAAFLLRAEDRP